MELRKYQAECVDAIFREWSLVRSTMAVLPTGAGKSVVFANVANRAEGRVLVLAHRTELVDQAVRHLDRVELAVDVEQADREAMVHTAWCVVASVQTLQSNRLARWPKNAFSHIIIDECHHATAKSYRAILDHFDAKVLGVTATPDRTDRVGMGSIFESVAYRMDIEDLVNDGFLVDVVAKHIVVPKWDISAIRVSSKATGGDRDLIQSQIDKAMTEEQLYHDIANPLIKESAGRPTLVYMPGVHSSTELKRILGGYVDPDTVGHLDGKTHPQIRSELLKGFRDGRIKILTNCMILTEGVDLPNAEVIALARPTKSRSLFSQILGRGMRPDPSNASKKTMTFLNFVPEETGHHELVTPLDVLGGRPMHEVSDEVRECAEEFLRQGMRPRDAMTAAEREIAERLTEEDRLKREEEAARRARVLAHNQMVSVDAAYSIGNQGEWERERKEIEKDRPSQRVAEFLQKHGMSVVGLNKRQASEKMRKYTNRLSQGLCTYKQMKCLKNAGLRYMDVSREEASEIINILVANKWRATPELRRKYGPLQLVVNQ